MRFSRSIARRSLSTVVLSLATVSAIRGEGGSTFTDIAADDGAGITYRRVRSPRDAIFDEFKEQPAYTAEDAARTPSKSRGIPGVALVDYDADGDLDIYVTNGPGAANSLYSNQLRETGAPTFVDLAALAGVEAVDQDSSGVCFGDLDNDGDADLYVLGDGEPNRLFENQGKGTDGVVRFVDATATSGLDGGDHASGSCSMGDVDGDGLLDVVIANYYDPSTQLAVLAVPWNLNQPNQLFRNQGRGADGRLVFADVSESSGILDLDFSAEAPPGAGTITWAIALADVDLDGDVDLLQADDQGPIAGSVEGGFDRGYIQLLENDGRGFFTAVTRARGLGVAAGWMGLAFADFDHNGRLDVFVTNFGNHSISSVRPGQPIARNRDSRSFLQREDGTFADSVTGEFLDTPFGWGVSAADFDNDGDSDVIYHGGMDLGLLVTVAPGVVLANDGSGTFRRDVEALAGSTNHSRRTVHGVAAGDLDGNGFVDVVSASNFDMPEPIELELRPFEGAGFQVGAGVLRTFLPVGPGAFTWSGLELPDGTLSVELGGDNGNRWTKIELVGTAGITTGGRSNRDGIGAVVRCKPQGMPAVLMPVLGGSSYASQDSLDQVCGLGTAAERAVVDVTWPGGGRNRFFVTAGARSRLPEIPCSFDDPDLAFVDYLGCVLESLDELEEARLVSRRRATRLLLQSIRAWNSEH